MRAEQIEPPLFFSLADNWIPGYARPTNDTLTFRVTTVGNITTGGTVRAPSRVYSCPN